MAEPFVNQIIEKMMAGLGDDIDPAMMAALMATTALVAKGASNEEVRDISHWKTFCTENSVCHTSLNKRAEMRFSYTQASLAYVTAKCNSYYEQSECILIAFSTSSAPWRFANKVPREWVEKSCTVDPILSLKPPLKCDLHSKCRDYWAIESRIAS